MVEISEDDNEERRMNFDENGFGWYSDMRSQDDIDSCLERKLWVWALLAI